MCTGIGVGIGLFIREIEMDRFQKPTPIPIPTPTPNFSRPVLESSHTCGPEQPTLNGYLRILFVGGSKAAESVEHFRKQLI